MARETPLDSKRIYMLFEQLETYNPISRDNHGKTAYPSITFKSSGGVFIFSTAPPNSGLGRSITMTKQLSLFPHSALNLTGSLQDEQAADLDMALNPVDEIFSSLARFKSGRGFMELLRFIARFPNYSVFNGLLLYLQNPSATYVATARTWAQKYKRQPAGDAKPLVILAPMAPILFLFDIQDTEGSPVPSSLLRPQEIDDRQLGKLYTTTLHNAALHGISVHETDAGGDQIDAVSRITPALRKKYQDLKLPKDTSYIIFIDKSLPIDGRYASLAHELGHIFCSHLGIDRHAWWPERGDINIRGETVEAGSVAFLVCRRNGLMANSENFLLQLSDAYHEMPPLSLNAVIQAAGYIEDMGKHRWKAPKKRR